MKNIKSVPKNKKGFTLLEVLVVVAIVAALAAVAFISVSNYRKTIKQKELDDKAELVYVAAQCQMTEMQANGRKDDYNEENNPQKVGMIPCDADDTITIDSLLYVTIDDGDMAQIILPDECVDPELREGHWVIEYNPDTSMIYGVFYSDDEFDYEPTVLDEYRGTSKDRLKKGGAIGYYGGCSTTLEKNGTLKPNIEVINGEKLIVNFTCNSPDGSDLEFIIGIEDEYGNSQAISVRPTVNTSYKQDIWSAKVVLDDLSSEDTRFKNVCPDLVPGSDLKITFKVTSASDTIEDASTTADTNGLFFYNHDKNADSATAYITACRHLQNIDESSGIGESNITKAIQQGDLRFGDDTEKTNDWYDYYGEDSYKPVSNENIVSYTVEDNCGIYNLSIDSGSANAGIFDTYYGSKLSNIILVGENIKSGTNTGAIAGVIAADCEISGCQIYLDEANGDLSGKSDEDKWLRLCGTNVGGLVGKVDSGVTLNISSSFAATVLGEAEKTENAGGLVGLSNGTVKISESYADNYIYGENVAGLVGYASSAVTVESCYTAGFLYSDNAAGLVNGEADMSYSYSVCYFRTENMENVYPTAISGSGNGSTYYYESDTFEKKNCKSVSDTSAKKYDELSDKTAMAALLGDKFTDEVDEKNSTPYNLTDLGLTEYSYPKLKNLHHYNDWMAEFEQGSLVYYEVYEDETYGFYAKNLNNLSDEKVIIGDGYGILYTQNNNGGTDKDLEAEYVISAKMDGTEITIAENGSDYEKVKVNGDEDGKGYRLCRLDTEIVSDIDAESETYYHKLEAKGNIYYFNPHFAKTAHKSENTSDTDEAPENMPETVSIRTPRNLYNLSKFYDTFASVAGNTTFKLERDIDYTTYEWTEYTINEEAVDSQRPIGRTVGTAFCGIFDGDYRTISGVSVEGTEDDFNVGLFGVNSGTIKNVVFMSEYSIITRTTDEDNNRKVRTAAMIQSNKTGKLGIFVGENNGTITNCATAGYTLTATAYRAGIMYTGLFAGVNNGTIKNCEGNSPLIRIETTYASAEVGGFVGCNTSVIEKCYGISYIDSSECKEGNVTDGGFTAENSGSIKYCYCTTSVLTGGSAVAYGFSPLGGSTVRCAYLYGGTYYYINTIYPFEVDTGDTRPLALTYDELKSNPYTGIERADKVIGRKYSENSDDSERDAYKYPFTAFVTDGNGDYVHYGEWVTVANLGSVGVFYWEYESGSDNAGYHISYINADASTGEFKLKAARSLCEAHDDDGIVTEYGYGYFFDSDIDEEKIVLTEENFGSHKVDEYDENASNALAKKLKGFTFRAFKTTGTAGVDKDTLYIDTDDLNGVWYLKYTEEINGEEIVRVYTFEINPFFADSFSFMGYTDGDSDIFNKFYQDDTEGIYYIRTKGKDGEPFEYETAKVNGKNTKRPVRYYVGKNSSFDYTEYVTEPGLEDNPYEIRSVDQLQFINWNSTTQNAVTRVENMEVLNNNNLKYTYLNYFGTLIGDIVNKIQNEETYDRVFEQSHDVDGENAYLIPIGSMHRTASGLLLTTIAVYFDGTYDGGDYVIKNFNITSTSSVSGLFGIVMNAELKNIALLSESGNNTITIETTSVDDLSSLIDALSDQYNTYNIGSLVGYAAAGSRGSTITNCTSAGFKIIDKKALIGLGGGNIGGLIGGTNVDIKNCSAVNDISLQFTHYNAARVVRVGGLVGTLRASMQNCYSGGSIECTTTRAIAGYTLITKEPIYMDGGFYTEVYAGGLVGGINMIKLGSFDNRTGGVDKQAEIINCYTYTEMPKDQSTDEASKIVASMAIGSNAEFMDEGWLKKLLDHGANTNLKIYESYALASAAQYTYDFLNCNDQAYWGDNEAKIHIRSTGKYTSLPGTMIRNSSSPYVEYSEMKTLFSGVSGFAPITTRTKYGGIVNGKYTHTISSLLNGLDYPFPTVLTQTDANGDTVNIHYGDFPLNSTHWSDYWLSVDILRDADKETKTVTVSTYIITGTDDAVKPEISILDASGENPDTTGYITLGNVSIGAYDSSKQGFPVTITVTGAPADGESAILIIRAEKEEVVSDLCVQVTAKINAETDIIDEDGNIQYDEDGVELEGLEMYSGDTGYVQLIAKTSGVRTKTGETDEEGQPIYEESGAVDVTENCTWEIATPNGVAAEVIKIAVAEGEEITAIKVNASKEITEDDGANITVTAKYEYNGQTYTASTLVSIVVKLDSYLGLVYDKDASNNYALEAKIPHEAGSEAVAAGEKTFTNRVKRPDLESSMLYLYYTGNSFDASKLDLANATVSGGYNVSFGMAQRGETNEEEPTGYFCIPIRITKDGAVQEEYATLTVEYDGREYTFTFKPQIVTLTFDGAEGIEAIEVNKGEKITLPTVSDANFDYWTVGSVDGLHYASGASYTMTADTVAYAHFKDPE